MADPGVTDRFDLDAEAEDMFDDEWESYYSEEESPADESLDEESQDGSFDEQSQDDALGEESEDGSVGEESQDESLDEELLEESLDEEFLDESLDEEFLGYSDEESSDMSLASASDSSEEPFGFDVRSGDIYKEKDVSPSLAVLVSPAGLPLVILKVLCNGAPLRAISLVDPATGQPNLRFVAPRPGGRVTVYLQNDGLEEGFFYQLERAELGPGETWDDCRPAVVNEANVVFHGNSTTVRRDVSTGGRSILVEALRDASGRTLSDVDAELRGLRRSKWRLGVWPGVFERKLLDGCEWLLSTQRGPSAVLVSVKAPTGRMVFAACPATDSLDSLKESVEQQLGILRAEQELRTQDGSTPQRLSDVLGDRPAVLYACGKQRRGPWLWLYVRHERGTKFVVVRASDTAFSVRRRLGGLGTPLDRLYLAGKELQDDRPLAEYGVECLSTLELREHGAGLQVTVEVFPLAPGKPPVLVQLGADPADTVETLRWGAVFKSTSIPKGHRATALVAQNPSFGLFMEDRELPLNGTVAECGITSGARLCFRRRNLDPNLPKMPIFVRLLDGSHTTIECFEWSTILEVKQAVKDHTGFEAPTKEMRLIGMGVQHEDELTLCESGVGKLSTLHLMLRLLGGGSASTSVGTAKSAGQAAPDGAQPIASATPPAQPAGALAVGKIVAGKFLPPEKTRTCHFDIDDRRPAPKLQFDIFVDEA